MEINPYSDVYCSVIHHSHDTEQIYRSMSGWMGKENVVAIHNEPLFSTPKEGNFAFLNNMNESERYYIA